MNSTAASNAQPERPRLLVLTGTTASGKTAVSIPLAEALQGEIINADSRQIYRELEIGTAKPTVAERERVTHHFIDEKSITERWTAGDFSREARLRIRSLLEQGKTPLVVGGSMLYIRALLDGFYEGEDEGALDYGALREEWARRGAEVMYAELTAVDPALAARTHSHDHHRILRALAVYRLTGTPLSALQKKHSIPLNIPYVIVFLHGDRAETYQRVEQRAQAMVNAGLVEEVRVLWEKGFNDKNCHALATHGYQEVLPYLQGEITAEQMLRNIQQAVRHYVKRQLTWYRRDPRAVWLQRDFAETPEQTALRILAVLTTHNFQVPSAEK